MTLDFGRVAIGRRPALVGLAALSGLVGAFAVVRAAQNVWAVDAHRNLAAAPRSGTEPSGQTPHTSTRRSPQP